MLSSPKSLDSRLRSRLFRYGLSAAAVAATTSASDSAATVISFDPADISGNSIYFDLESNAVSTSPFAGADFNLFQGFGDAQKPSVSGYNGMNSILSDLRSGAQYAPQLNGGETIGSLGSFSSGAYLDNQDGTFGAGNGDWQAGDRGFLGLRLDTAGGPFFAWADISLNNLDGSGAGQFTLHRYAYEDVAGRSIQAGSTTSSVPDAGSTALLLLLGASGVAGLRARQARATLTR